MSTVEAPFFPRYLFVGFDPHVDPWGAIRHTRGVCALIRHAPDRPTPVPVGVVRAGRQLDEQRPNFRRELRALRLGGAHRQVQPDSGVVP